MITGNRFPIMDGPNVPWDTMAPHEKQAQINHDQTLARLAERGGLSSAEAYRIVHGLSQSESPRQMAEYRRLWYMYAERINNHYAELESLRAQISKLTGEYQACLQRVTEQAIRIVTLESANDARADEEAGEDL